MTSIRLENPGNTEWGKISLQYHGNEYQFPYHISSEQIFNYDPDPLIRVKCIALIGVTPLISIVRSVYWLSLSFFTALSEMYRYLDGQSPSQHAQSMIGERAWDSIRALSYGALMMKSALIGVFAPYQGRLQYGEYERELNRHLDGPHRNKFYLAICFQRLYVIPEDDTDEMESKLTQYLARIDAIRGALWGCSLQQMMVQLRFRPAKT